MLIPAGLLGILRGGRDLGHCIGIICELNLVLVTIESVCSDERGQKKVGYWRVTDQNRNFEYGRGNVILWM